VVDAEAVVATEVADMAVVEVADLEVVVAAADVADVTTAENPDILLATAAMSHPVVDVVVAAVVVVDLEAVPITAPATSVSRRVISLGIAPMSRRGVCEAALSVVELGI